MTIPPSANHTPHHTHAHAHTHTHTHTRERERERGEREIPLLATAYMWLFGNILTDLQCYTWSCRLIATMLILGQLIASRCVAELITTDAGRFSHVGLCQLHAKQFCTQLTKAWHSWNVLHQLFLRSALRMWLRSVHPITSCMENPTGTKSPGTRRGICDIAATRSTFAGFKTHFGYVFTIPTSGNISLGKSACICTMHNTVNVNEARKVHNGKFSLIQEHFQSMEWGHAALQFVLWWYLYRQQ